MDLSQSLWTTHALLGVTVTILVWLPAQVFRAVDADLAVEWSGRDGDCVAQGTKFGTVRGSARSLLVAERVALNFMQRISGIATATSAMAKEVDVSHLLFIVYSGTSSLCFLAML